MGSSSPLKGFAKEIEDTKRRLSENSIVKILFAFMTLCFLLQVKDEAELAETTKFQVVYLKNRILYIERTT
jgi:hypothetical protein